MAQSFSFTNSTSASDLIEDGRDVAAAMSAMIGGDVPVDGHAAAGTWKILHALSRSLDDALAVAAREREAEYQRGVKDSMAMPGMVERVERILKDHFTPAPAEGER